MGGFAYWWSFIRGGSAPAACTAGLLSNDFVVNSNIYPVFCFHPSNHFIIRITLPNWPVEPINLDVCPSVCLSVCVFVTWPEFHLGCVCLY